jgi:hypothetical protein
MRKMLLLLGIMALAAGLTPGIFALDVPLKYEMTSPRGMFPFGYGQGLFLHVKPAGNWRMPVFNSPRPLFALIKLADSSHLIVLDAIKPGDQDLSRLYVDSDGDRDLVEEKPLNVNVRKTKDSRILPGAFPPVEFSILTGNIRTPYRLRLDFPHTTNMISSMAVSLPFLYTAACGYRGDFVFGGTTCTMYLSDADGNGRFDDVTEIAESSHTPLHAKGDRVLFTEGKYRDQFDNQPLGDLLWLNDTLFRVKIDIPRGIASLSRIEGGLAPVKLPMRVERLSLYGEDKKGCGHCLMVYKPSSGVLMLPPGNYRLLSYVSYRRDAGGNLWRMCASGAGFAPAVSVSSPEGAVLTFGEPYVPVVGVVRNFRVISGDISLNFTVEGAGKERMLMLSTIESSQSGFNFLKGSGIGKRPAPPAYTIVKADGEIVAKGKFEYG